MLKLYSVYDRAVQSFERPFACKADGEAIRTFSDAVNDKSSPFFRHPLDFELYYVGTLDQSTGVIVCEGVRRLIAANDCVRDVAP